MLAARGALDGLRLLTDGFTVDRNVAASPVAAGRRSPLRVPPVHELLRSRQHRFVEELAAVPGPRERRRWRLEEPGGYGVA